jgi:TetR/AcrR family transcriptional repressor of lmrAB and yxaGH operons
MAGTPSPEGNPRDRIVEATITLMRRSGYSGAGLNEILRESGAPKGSMYHYFPGGKRQVAGEALAAYARQILAMFDESLSTGRTPGAKVRALFDARAKRLEKSAFRMSCAAGAACLDLDDDLDLVRLAIASAFADWIALIAKHFRFADSRRTRSFAGLVLTAIEGAYIRGRAEHSGRAFREAGAWLAEIAERESIR